MDEDGVWFCIGKDIIGSRDDAFIEPNGIGDAGRDDFSELPVRDCDDKVDGSIPRDEEASIVFGIEMEYG